MKDIEFECVYGKELQDLNIALGVVLCCGGKHNANSIMDYDVICRHDGGVLCEHRKEWIMKWVKEKLNANR